MVHIGSSNSIRGPPSRHTLSKPIFASQRATHQIQKESHLRSRFGIDIDSKKGASPTAPQPPLLKTARHSIRQTIKSSTISNRCSTTRSFVNNPVRRSKTPELRQLKREFESNQIAAQREAESLRLQTWIAERRAAAGSAPRASFDTSHSIEVSEMETRMRDRLIQSRRLWESSSNNINQELDRTTTHYNDWIMPHRDPFFTHSNDKKESDRRWKGQWKLGGLMAGGGADRADKIKEHQDAQDLGVWAIKKLEAQRKQDLVMHKDGISQRAALSMFVRKKFGSSDCSATGGGWLRKGVDDAPRIGDEENGVWSQHFTKQVHKSTRRDVLPINQVRAPVRMSQVASPHQRRSTSRSRSRSRSRSNSHTNRNRKSWGRQISLTDRRLPGASLYSHSKHAHLPKETSPERFATANEVWASPPAPVAVSIPLPPPPLLAPSHRSAVSFIPVSSSSSSSSGAVVPHNLPWCLPFHPHLVPRAPLCLPLCIRLEILSRPPLDLLLALCSEQLLLQTFKNALEHSCIVSGQRLSKIDASPASDPTISTPLVGFIDLTFHPPFSVSDLALAEGTAEWAHAYEDAKSVISSFDSLVTSSSLSLIVPFEKHNDKEDDPNQSLNIPKSNTTIQLKIGQIFSKVDISSIQHLVYGVSKSNPSSPLKSRLSQTVIQPSARRLKMPAAATKTLDLSRLDSPTTVRDKAIKLREEIKKTVLKIKERKKFLQESQKLNEKLENYLLQFSAGEFHAAISQQGLQREVEDSVELAGNCGLDLVVSLCGLVGHLQRLSKRDKDVHGLLLLAFNSYKKKLAEQRDNDLIYEKPLASLCASHTDVTSDDKLKKFIEKMYKDEAEEDLRQEKGNRKLHLEQDDFGKNDLLKLVFQQTSGSNDKHDMQHILDVKEYQRESIKLSTLSSIIPSLNILQLSALSAFNHLANDKTFYDYQYAAKREKESEIIKLEILGKLLAGDWDPLECPFKLDIHSILEPFESAKEKNLEDDINNWELKMSLPTIDKAAFALALHSRAKMSLKNHIPSLHKELNVLSEKYSFASESLGQKQLTSLLRTVRDIKEESNLTNNSKIMRVTVEMLKNLLESHKIPISPFMQIISENCINQEFITAQGIKDSLQLAKIIVERSEVSSANYSNWCIDTIQDTESKNLELELKKSELTVSLQNMKTARMEAEKMLKKMRVSKEQLCAEDASIERFVRRKDIKYVSNEEMNGEKDIIQRLYDERKHKALLVLVSGIRIWMAKRRIRRIRRERAEAEEKRLQLINKENIT